MTSFQFSMWISKYTNESEWILYYNRILLRMNSLFWIRTIDRQIKCDWTFFVRIFFKNCWFAAVFGIEVGVWENRIFSWYFEFIERFTWQNVSISYQQAYYGWVGYVNQINVSKNTRKRLDSLQKYVIQLILQIHMFSFVRLWINLAKVAWHSKKCRKNVEFISILFLQKCKYYLRADYKDNKDVIESVCFLMNWNRCQYNWAVQSTECLKTGKKSPPNEKKCQAFVFETKVHWIATKKDKNDW